MEKACVSARATEQNEVDRKLQDKFLLWQRQIWWEIFTLPWSLHVNYQFFILITFCIYNLTLFQDFK